jgi:hypothetical protein
MEVFVPSRDEGEVAELMVRLRALGLRGRDAAYLASVLPPSPLDPQADENFRCEFRFMVAPEQREEAARLVGLAHW